MCATVRCDCEDEKPRLRSDLLAKCVGQQRAALEVFQAWQVKAMASPTFKAVWDSSQVAHLLATLAVLVVCTTLYSGGQGSQAQSTLFLSLVYIISTALHFGSQFWMTFVSGLTLYFSLSRHAFGDVQQVLFPRYFTLNSLFSCVSLLSFAKLHQHLPEWSTHHYTQVYILSTVFLIESLARLYISPKVIASMVEVRQLELEVEGVGKEVGRHVPLSLAASPPYVAAYTFFRKQHSMMAIANILSISCSIAHLFYLARAIQFT